MATHGHSTRTPLLPPVRSAPPLLGQGLGRQLGPVTQAIRAMRAADPVLDPHQFTLGIRALSRTEVETLVEGLIDLLDAWDGDTDREDGHDAEGNTDDNGLGDYDALGEQYFRGYGGCL